MNDGIDVRRKRMLAFALGGFGIFGVVFFFLGMGYFLVLFGIFLLLIRVFIYWLDARLAILRLLRVEITPAWKAPIAISYANILGILVSVISIVIALAFGILIILQNNFCGQNLLC